MLSHKRLVENVVVLPRSSFKDCIRVMLAIGSVESGHQSEEKWLLGGG